MNAMTATERVTQPEPEGPHPVTGPARLVRSTFCL
jgi:hypothetical protein